MYDSWSAFDTRAVGTELDDALRRPLSERTDDYKGKAISYAAYQALADMLPVDIDAVYRPMMRRLGYDPENRSWDIETPEGVAHVACGAVLEYRHHDGSNQLGNLAAGSYSDWSRYKSANRPLFVQGGVVSVSSVGRWQPLTYVDESGNLETQRFMGAQWRYVLPLP